MVRPLATGEPQQRAPEAKRQKWPEHMAGRHTSYVTCGLARGKTGATQVHRVRCWCSKVRERGDGAMNAMKQQKNATDNQDGHFSFVLHLHTLASV